MVRLGVIGLGRIGQIHAYNVSASARATLAAVYDPDGSRLQEASKRYGCKQHSTFEDLLSDPEVDAIVIASPTELHVDQVMAAAKIGRPMLCEKPLSLDLDTAKRARDFVAARNAHFMIALNKRFDPSLSQLRSRIQSGEIGRLEALMLIGKDPSPPPGDYIRTSGGIFRDMMIHDIDLAVFLAGEYPTEVWATGSALISPVCAEVHDHDTASAILKMPSGAIATHSVSRRSAAGFDQRVEVHGEKGTLRTRNQPVDLTESWTAGGIQTAVHAPFFLERYAAAYAAELEYFIDTLDGKQNALDVNHAVIVQTIADAVTAAARTAGQSIKYD
ncbi:Gfo/Idh/MocA family oxidoreductase [Rhizobium sp. 18055]|uniref:Gfo/Idh/MocA family protein n=1 Tax=Rhizobium sp. 18055 TaxID=2681403 RepID=UPI00135C685D|nr:Gfo/Idh/MocA family oxidoreductase [Rhizobium sp. 18055]